MLSELPQIADIVGSTGRVTKAEISGLPVSPRRAKGNIDVLHLDTDVPIKVGNLELPGRPPAMRKSTPVAGCTLLTSCPN
jgi:hypothetical protein